MTLARSTAVLGGLPAVQVVVYAERRLGQSVLVWRSSLAFGGQVPDEAITTELVMKVRSLCRPVQAGSLAASALVGSALVVDGPVVMVAGGRPR
jgi:hypothetical protein